jgi:hypothetical protein
MSVCDSSPRQLEQRSYFAASARMRPKYHRKRFLRAIAVLDIMYHEQSSLEYSGSILAATCFYFQCEKDGVHNISMYITSLIIYPPFNNSTIEELLQVCTGYSFAQIEQCYKYVQRYKDVLREASGNIYPPKSSVIIEASSVQTYNPLIITALVRALTRC